MNPEVTFVQHGGPRACKNCAEAKLRCSPHSTSNKCERCFRLRKECTAREMRQRKKRETSSRNHQLEQKLDNIASLLASRQANGEQPLAQNPSPASSSEAWNRPSPAQHQGADPNPPAQLQLPVSGDEANSLLQDFQRHFAAHVPFIAIPCDLPAPLLRDERPVLYAVIMSIASYANVQRQKRWTSSILAYLADQIVVQARRNLDLLQACLVLATWYHFNANFTFQPKAMQPTSLMHLATVLIDDLRLRQPPNSRDAKALVMSPSQEAAFPDTTHARSLSPEERRTLAGCYYLTFLISNCMWRLDTLHMTSYAEQCIRELHDHPEYERDVELVQLVWLHGIVEKHERNRASNGGGGAPVWLYTKACQSELQKFRKSLPENLQQSKTIQMHIHTAEIRILQVALIDPPKEPGNDETKAKQTEILHECLVALKSFFDLFSSMPLASAHTTPFTLWAQSYQALVVAILLVFREGEEWMRRHVLETLNLPEALEGMATFVEAAWKTIEAAGMTSSDECNLFFLWARRLRMVKTPFETRSAVPTENAQAGHANSPGAETGDPPSALPSASFPTDWAGWSEDFSGFFDLSDDALWQITNGVMM